MTTTDTATNAPTCAQCGKATRTWYQPLIGIENFCREPYWRGACVAKWVDAHYTDGTHRPDTTCTAAAHSS